MKRLYLIGVVLFFVGLLGSAPVLAQSARDCDNNAMLYCGAMSPSEFNTKLTQGDGLRSGQDLTNLYAVFGVNATEVNVTVPGVVTKTGDVIVNGQIVATDARSFGRQYMSGSTAFGFLWSRPPAVSFRQSTLSAMVYLVDGQFKWAIINSCGNMVTAQAKPAPMKPASVTQVTPPPIAAPAPPAPLPATGATAISGTLGLSFIGYALWRWRQSRRQLVAAHRRY
jgi:hypothetical protein